MNDDRYGIVFHSFHGCPSPSKKLKMTFKSQQSYFEFPMKITANHDEKWEMRKESLLK